MDYGILRAEAVEAETRVNRLFEEWDRGGQEDPTLDTQMEALEAFIGVIRTRLGISALRPSEWPAS